MTVDARVKGSDLAALSKRLRAAGDEGKGLKKELRKGILRSVKPARRALKLSAGQRMPQRGGYAKRLARTSVQTRIMTGRNPGVRLVAKRVDARLDTAGRLRHPVFGNRQRWVTQQVPVGWWSKPLEAEKPRMRGEIVRVMDDVARQIGDGR